MRIPVPTLFITYNRLEYTKRALLALMESDCGHIYVIDNGSTDGTVEYLQGLKHLGRCLLIYRKENAGIAGAMNTFIHLTKAYPVVGKVDNDTVVPKNWCSVLREKLSYCELDIIQARHPILKETFAGGFDKWMLTMKQDEKDKSVYHSSFVGGSGILFKTKNLKPIPKTDWKLYGWRQFQKDNPNLKKAFTTDVTIDLLDMHPDGGANYPKEYLEYYKETKRC